MSKKLLSEFNQHLQSLLSQLTDDLTPPSRLVIALSGGVDSVVLLHLLAEFKKNNEHFQVIAHNVNHGLSDNANDWTHFCARLCDNLAIPFISSKVVLQKKNRCSLEALARDARYQCFQDNMQVNDIILTGHHQDDQLETLLLALKRGSGSTGLQGIRTQQRFFTGLLLRPLLIFSREQLIDYANLHQLQWVEDESNQDVEFDRNFIRHKISPLLIERWPAIAKSASRTAQLCQEQQHLLDEVANEDLHKCVVVKFAQQTLSIVNVSVFSEARRHNLLRHWLKVNGLQYPSYKQLQVLWQEVALALPDKQPKLQLESHSIRRYQGYLYIVAETITKLPTAPVKWSGEQLLWLVEGELGVDFSKVDTSLLRKYQIQCCLRSHFKPQLSCQPLGRGKPRSIKKLLQEYNVPTWLREKVVFVLVDGQLVEAIGLWTCQHSITSIQKEHFVLSLCAG